MSRVPKCCVLDCRDKTSVRHRFPKTEKDVFEIWKQRAQHPRFINISNEHIYKVYTMCGAHFNPEDQIPHSKKLKKRVLPTINIPGLDETVPMIKNVSSEDAEMNRQHDNQHGVIMGDKINEKPVKRKSDDLESTDEKVSKKQRTSSANDKCIQDILSQNEIGHHKHTDFEWCKYRKSTFCNWNRRIFKITIN